MSATEEEAEIKIEYFESYEEDPLCKNTEKNTREDDRTDFFISRNFLDENINQDVSSAVKL